MDKKLTVAPIYYIDDIKATDDLTNKTDTNNASKISDDFYFKFSKDDGNFDIHFHINPKQLVYKIFEAAAAIVFE